MLLSLFNHFLIQCQTKLKIPEDDSSCIQRLGMGGRGTRGRAGGVPAEEPDREVGESGAWRLRGRSAWGYHGDINLTFTYLGL